MSHRAGQIWLVIIRFVLRSPGAKFANTTTFVRTAGLLGLPGVSRSVIAPIDPTLPTGHELRAFRRIFVEFLQKQICVVKFVPPTQHVRTHFTYQSTVPPPLKRRRILLLSARQQRIRADILDLAAPFALGWIGRLFRGHRPTVCEGTSI